MQETDLKFRDIKLDSDNPDIELATGLVDEFFKELEDLKEHKGYLWEYKDDIIKLIALSFIRKELNKNG